MKQTEEIKTMIRGMMDQEMEYFKEAVSNGDADETALPVVYTMLQVLMAKIEAMPKVWHKPDEKPEHSREPILQLQRDMSAGTLFFSMLKNEEEVQIMTSHIVAWCYFEDLLPQWIKVVGSDKMNTKKCVMRDDELQSNTAKED
jgi:hypothetical protein